jgi:hypothetical protein
MQLQAKLLLGGMTSLLRFFLKYYLRYLNEPCKVLLMAYVNVYME